MLDSSRARNPFVVGNRAVLRLKCPFPIASPSSCSYSGAEGPSACGISVLVGTARLL